jgi:hypothetical protein
VRSKRSTFGVQRSTFNVQRSTFVGVVPPFLCPPMGEANASLSFAK